VCDRRTRRLLFRISFFGLPAITFRAKKNPAGWFARRIQDLTP